MVKESSLTNLSLLNSVSFVGLSKIRVQLAKIDLTALWFAFSGSIWLIGWFYWYHYDPGSAMRELWVLASPTLLLPSSSLLIASFRDLSKIRKYRNLIKILVLFIKVSIDTIAFIPIPFPYVFIPFPYLPFPWALMAAEMAINQCLILYFILYVLSKRYESLMKIASKIERWLRSFREQPSLG